MRFVRVLTGSLENWTRQDHRRHGFCRWIGTAQRWRSVRRTLCRGGLAWLLLLRHHACAGGRPQRGPELRAFARRVKLPCGHRKPVGARSRPEPLVARPVNGARPRGGRHFSLRKCRRTVAFADRVPRGREPIRSRPRGFDGAAHHPDHTVTDTVPLRSSIREEAPLNTRMLAIIAVVVAVIVLIIVLV